MNRSAKAYTFVSLAAVLAVFFAAGTAEAVYNVRVDLSNSGNGEGNVTFSATSSSMFEFSGWSGETCTGNGKCFLKRLVPDRLKSVIASFNAPVCDQFIYSNFGACGLDGKMYRDLIAAGPPGCYGGDVVTSWTCTPLGGYVPPPPASFVPYTFIPDDTHTVQVNEVNPDTGVVVTAYYDAGCLTGCVAMKDYTKVIEAYHTELVPIIVETVTFHDTYTYIHKDPAYNYSVPISDSTGNQSGTLTSNGTVTGVTGVYVTVPYNTTTGNKIINVSPISGSLTSYSYVTPSGNDASYITQQQARDAAEAQLKQAELNKAAAIDALYGEKVTCVKCLPEITKSPDFTTKIVDDGPKTVIDTESFAIAKSQAEIDAATVRINYLNIQDLAQQAQDAADANPNNQSLQQAAANLATILDSAQRNDDAAQANLAKGKLEESAGKINEAGQSFGDVAVNADNTDIDFLNAQSEITDSGIMDKSAPCQNLTGDDKTFLDKFIDFFTGLFSGDSGSDTGSGSTGSGINGGVTPPPVQKPCS